MRKRGPTLSAIPWATDVCDWLDCRSRLGGSGHSAGRLVLVPLVPLTFLADMAGVVGAGEGAPMTRGT